MACEISNSMPKVIEIIPKLMKQNVAKLQITVELILV